MVPVADTGESPFADLNYHDPERYNIPGKKKMSRLGSEKEGGESSEVAARPHTARNIIVLC
jgi:hypothetical protein